MPRDADQYDLFVSYAHQDNAEGWITQFLNVLREEHRKFQPEGELKYFFDQHDIGSLDDWRHRIYGSLAGSRLFLAFLSPKYFASEWCRREWRTWIDLEIAKHIMSAGAAPIYIIEVPGLDGSDEQEVARKVYTLCKPPGSTEAFVADVSPVVRQLRRRQYESVQPFYRAGLEALRRDELRRQLAKLARELDKRATLVRQGAESPTTVPPYNKRFSGRLEELQTLRKQLMDDRAGVISGIHGLGGVGKTELAFTYAHAFAAAYPGGRFLVPCENKSDLAQACLQLDEIFHDQIDDEARKAPDRHFAAIRSCLARRLEQRGHVLLVLDNVTTAGLLAGEQTDVLTALGPKLHLLATTRLPPTASRQIRWTTLGELPENDALELLDKHRAFADDAEREAGRKIVRRLGGFALAIELVASWLAAHPEVGRAGFLERLGLEDLEALDAASEDSDVELRRHNHERRLSAVLSPTIKAVTDESAAARRALEFAAFLPADHIAWPWLKALVEADFPDVGQPAKPGYPNPWYEVRRTLEKYALVTRASEPGDDEGEIPDARIVRVHRLLQGLVRRALPGEESVSQQRAIEVLIRSRVEELAKVTRWTDARWELDPLEALAQQWTDAGDPRGIWLLNATGFHWQNLAEWARAEPLFRQALAIMETALGPGHQFLAPHLNNLAALLQETNRLAEAEQLYRRAVAILEASNGPQDPDLAAALGNLAQLLQQTNRLAEAERLIRQALVILELSFGQEHPRVALCLDSLAKLLMITNRLTQAVPLVRRALAIDETSFGPEHPKVAARLHSLAHLLQETNQFAESEPVYRRVLAIDEASFGPEHPKVASALNGLATLLCATNRRAEAEPLMRRSLAINEASFGPDHPDVANSLNNLAQLLQDTNRLAEAEPLMRRALAIDEASFDPDHPSVARDLGNLASLLSDTNRLTEAEPLMRRALAIHEASPGQEHQEVIAHLKSLAELLARMNRRDEAEPLYRRALAIVETRFGPDHPNVATAANNLAQLLQDMDQLPKAESLARRALAIDETSFGPQHPKVATDLNNLATMLWPLGKLDEAEPLYRRALEIDERALGSDHATVACDLSNLASLLYVTGRPAEAEPMMRRALVCFLRFSQAAGHDDPHLQSVVQRYAMILRATGLGEEGILGRLNELGRPFGISFGC